MKKILIIAIIAINLVACSKQSADLETRAAAAAPAPDPELQKYFSRVRYFHDNRTPAVDTVWTLRLTDSVMVNHYTTQHGYIFADSRIVTEKGVLWSK